MIQDMLIYKFLFYWQWVPEITHHKAGTPFLLVGTQMDLRNDQQTIQKLAKNKQKPITTEQGDSMAKQKIKSREICWVFRPDTG